MGHQVMTATMAAMVLLVYVMSFSAVSGVDATLRYDYYKTSCPNVEKIIFQEIRKAYLNDSTVAPGVLRLIFHDCFVRGCDASVLLAGPTTERAAVPTSTHLHGFEAIDQVKDAVEKACPGVVSCADILAYASRDTVILTKGKGWEVPAGRMDGRISNAVEVDQNLPPATFTSAQLIANFAAKGLSAKQMVDLSGSHTIGITHCGNLRDRIFSVIDHTMPKNLLAQLQRKCPTLGSPTPMQMDRLTGNTFDTRYFRNIANGRGLLTSDQDLFRDAATRPFVQANLRRSTFDRNFAEAMVAMTNIDVKVGTNQGEIRKHCQFVN